MDSDATDHLTENCGKSILNVEDNLCWLVFGMSSSFDSSLALFFFFLNEQKEVMQPYYRKEVS